MADPALNRPQTPEERQKSETIAPHEEAWLKAGEKTDAENASESIGEKEARLAKEGTEKLNELGKNLNLQAEAGAQEFEQQTKSWWGRAKERLFRKKEEGATQTETPAVAKGEAEILGEIEKADAVFAEFRKKAGEIMASGDEAGLRMLERSLSKSYEDLAPQVAAEGAAEAKAMKKALKTGEMPQITETGAKLNYVAQQLMEVRGRLGGAQAKPEAAAMAVPEAPPRKPQAEIVEEAQPADEEELFTEAEKAQLAADAAKLGAPAEEAAPKEPAPRVPSLNEILTGRPDAEPAVEQAASVEAAAEAPKKPDADAADRELLAKASAGKPGEKLVDEYLKLRAAKSDSYGAIVGHSFDPIKGEIRLKYEDGGQFRKYANGLMLRVHPGGQVEEIPEPSRRKAEMAERVDAAMKAQDRAEMAARVDAAMEAEDAAAGGEIELEEADIERAEAENQQESREEREKVLERARSIAEGFLKSKDAAFSVDIKDLRVTPDDPSKSPYDVRALFIKHSGDRRMNWTQEVALDPAKVEAELENVVSKVYDEKMAAEAAGGETETPTLSVEPGPDLEMSPAPVKSPREVYPNLPEPAPGSRPPGVPEAPAVEKPAEAPAEKPAATPEAPESAFGKLEAKLDDAAAELLKMPEAAESPKTFPTKVGKLPADKFLEAFKAAGAVDAQGAKDFAERFKMDSEGFNALRKKLAQTVRKKLAQTVGKNMEG
ncbi:MAG TPA: hypothetical protein VJ694_05220 [Patescibacteria group bacterium]|nr:hypothetical protein [Patescibacteria group bacterium]